MDLAQLGSSLQGIFSVNSQWGVVARAALWFVVAIIIIASTDTSGLRQAKANLRASLGGFMLFLVLCGGLVYLLFGFVPVA
jgi:hypothetical protein